MAKAVSSLDVFIVCFIGSLRFVPRAKAPGSAFVPVMFPFRRLLVDPVAFDDLAARVHDVDVDSPAVGLHHELVPVRIYEDREVRAPAPVVYPLVAVVVPA